MFISVGYPALGIIAATTFYRFSDLILSTIYRGYKLNNNLNSVLAEH